MTELNFHRLSGSDAELMALVDLFNAVWPQQQHLDAVYLDWLYRKNPAGSAIGMNAWSGNQVVGHYAVVPITASIHGQSVTAALSLNTAVHPSVQGRGLFTALAERTYQAATAVGIDHVIGVANANSTPGFIRKLSFQLVGALQARILLSIPAPSAPLEPSPDWERQWNKTDYAWRLANPKANYRWSPFGERIAWWSDTGYSGVRALMHDVGTAPQRELVMSKLKRTAFTPVKLYIGLRPRSADTAIRGFDLPGVLRPSPLNLIFRGLQRPGEQLQKDRVSFGLLDFDAY